MTEDSSKYLFGVKLTKDTNGTNDTIQNKFFCVITLLDAANVVVDYNGSNKLKCIKYEEIKFLDDTCKNEQIPSDPGSCLTNYNGATNNMSDFNNDDGGKQVVRLFIQKKTTTSYNIYFTKSKLTYYDYNTPKVICINDGTGFGINTGITEEKMNSPEFFKELFTEDSKVQAEVEPTAKLVDVSAAESTGGPVDGSEDGSEDGSDGVSVDEPVIRDEVESTGGPGAKTDGLHVDVPVDKSGVQSGVQSGVESTDGVVANTEDVSIPQKNNITLLVEQIMKAIQDVIPENVNAVTPVTQVTPVEKAEEKEAETTEETAPEQVITAPEKITTPAAQEVYTSAKPSLAEVPKYQPPVIKITEDHDSNVYKQKSDDYLSTLALKLKKLQGIKENVMEIKNRRTDKEGKNPNFVFNTGGTSSGGTVEEPNDNINSIKEIIKILKYVVEELLKQEYIFKMNSLSADHFNTLFNYEYANHKYLIQFFNKNASQSSSISKDATNNIKELLTHFMFVDVNLNMFLYKHYNKGIKNDSLTMIKTTLIKDYLTDNETKIERDYNNYIILTTGNPTTGNRIYVDYKEIDRQSEYHFYIKHFIELVDYYFNDSLEIDNPENFEKIWPNNIFFIQFLIDTIENYIEHVIPYIYEINRILQYQNNPFINKLNQLVNTEVNDSILTYLKIRVDKYKDKYYINDRFDIYLNAKNSQAGKNDIDDSMTKVIIKYNNDNVKYYLDDESKEVTQNINDKYKAILEKHNNDNIPNLTINQKLFQTYDKTYLFGKFNKIFLPYETNEQIAEKMNDEVFNQLIHGKNIFMLGYGASGSGKTSSLIYFRSDKQNGILVHLCNKMGAAGWTNLKVKTVEFYQSYLSNTENKMGNDATEKCTYNDGNKQIFCSAREVGDTNQINFIYEKDQPEGQEKGQEKGFRLSGEYIHTVNHPYRIETLQGLQVDVDYTVSGDLNKVAKLKRSFKENTLLGELLIYLIDTDRFVKATTNNPNSSRSHTLVYLEFTNESLEITNESLELKDNQVKTCKLIIGDFAGVENKFKCDDDEVKKRFFNIARDDGSGLPYYSTEVIRGNPDPIITQKGGADIDVNDIITLDESLKCTIPVYDFNHPTHENRKQQNNDIVSVKTKFIDKLAKNNIPTYVKLCHDVYLTTYLKNLQKLPEFNKIQNTLHEDISYFENITTFDNLKDKVCKDLRIYTVTELNTLNQKFVSDITTILKYNFEIINTITKTPKQLQSELNTETITLNELIKTKENEQTILKILIDKKINAEKMLTNALNWANNNKNGDKIKIYDTNIKNINTSLNKISYNLITIYDPLDQNSNNANKLINFLKNTENPIHNYTDKNTYFMTNSLITLSGKFNNKELLIKHANKFKIYDSIPVQTNNSLDDNIKNATVKIQDLGEELKQANISQGQIEKQTKIITDIVEKITKIKNDYNSSLGLTYKDVTNTSLKNDIETIKTILTNKKELLTTYVKNLNALMKKLENAPYIDSIDDLIHKNLLKTNKGEELIIGDEIIENLNYLFKDKVNILGIFNTPPPSPPSPLTLGNINGAAYIQLNKMVNILIEDLINNRGFLTIFNLYLEKLYRSNNIDDICDHRVTEGKFINYSLLQLRKTIKNILIEKNKDKINISPQYIGECLNKYCPLDNVCFDLQDSKIETEDIIKDDIIFKYIAKLLNNGTENNSIKYENFIMGVFCVLNASMYSPSSRIFPNNPPPIPYLDINEIKLSFNKIKGLLNINDTVRYFTPPGGEEQPSPYNLYPEFQSLKKSIRDFMLFIQEKFTDGGTPGGTAGGTADGTIIEFKNPDTEVIEIITSDIFEFINTFISYTKYEDFLITIFDNQTISTTIYKSNTIISLLKSKKNILKETSFYDIITQFITLIDNNNAASSIGTIEYLDLLSKFNTVDTICTIKDTDIDYNNYYNLNQLKVIDEKNLIYSRDTFLINLKPKTGSIAGSKTGGKKKKTIHKMKKSSKKYTIRNI